MKTPSIASQLKRTPTSKAENAAFIDIFSRIMTSTKPSSSEDTMRLIFEESISQLTKGQQIKKEKIPQISVYNNNKYQDHQLITNKLLRNVQLKNELEITMNKTIKQLELIENDYELTNYLTKLIINFDSFISNNQFKPIKYDNQHSDILSKIQSSQQINELTFPIILLKGFNLLSNKFNSNDQILNLIQLLKKQSIKTFFYGLTIDLVNVSIKVNYKLFKDINKINLLIEELKINGIQTNIETFTILKQIIKDFKVMNEDDEIQLLQLEEFIQ